MRKNEDVDYILNDRTYDYYNLGVKVSMLKAYYKRNGELTIIGLNDSQGVNTTALFKKGLLEFISDKLKDEDTKTTVINAFSLMFNKTEHINYLLRSNPDLEEIKDLQVYGMVSALEKAMSDFHLPKDLGKIGYISRKLYKPNRGDKYIKLTDTLQMAKEPIVVYSSGANDIMREGWNNPFNIGKDYKKQNAAYKYTLDKLSDVSTVKRVIDRVDENFNNILSLNDKADIFALGLYVPRSMKKDGMEVFNAAIERYNEFLKILCEKYNIEYVDTQDVAEMNNKSNLNFHVTTNGHYFLANEVLSILYNRKICKRSKANVSNVKNFKPGRHDLYELLVDLKKDFKNAVKEGVLAMDNDDREYDVAVAKRREIERQIDVVEKTLMKRM